MLKTFKKVTNSPKYVNYLGCDSKMGMIVRLNRQGQESEAIAQVVAKLKAGGIVCVPSDTCYGLSCLATSNEATEKLRRIKKRGPLKKFILIVRDVKTAISYSRKWSREAMLITDAFWPGPISVVVPFRQLESCPIAHTSKSIAIRVPASDILRQIVEEVTCPLWSTSANDPGSAPPRNLGSIPSYILTAVDAVLDIGELINPCPSTVIDLSTNKATILRKGPITANDITSKTKVSLES